MLFKKGRNPPCVFLASDFHHVVVLCARNQPQFFRLIRRGKDLFGIVVLDEIIFGSVQQKERHMNMLHCVNRRDIVRFG